MKTQSNKRQKKQQWLGQQKVILNLKENTLLRTILPKSTKELTMSKTQNLIVDLGGWSKKSIKDNPTWKKRHRQSIQQF